jgi:hypothetical protein
MGEFRPPSNSGLVQLNADLLCSCNPSVTVQLGSRPDSSVAKLQNMVLVTALFHGWYVSIADDTGTQASYSNGLHSAYASLDSIRAIKQSGNITGISADPIVTINGYSSGAITVGWVREKSHFHGLLPNSF